MTNPRQLLSAGEAGWPRADNRDPLAGAPRRDLRLDPAFLPATVYNRSLDVLDAHWIVGNVQGAGSLAGGWANPACEFWEIVGCVQCVEGAEPITLMDQVVPVGNQVIDRATVVAIRNTAIHAPGALLTQFSLGQRNHKFPIMLDPFGNWRIGVLAALDFLETCWLAHTHSPAKTLTSSRSSIWEEVCISSSARR